MNKKGMFIGILLLILSAVIISFSFDIPIQTDSGWDTDYSSGGSDSYSSSEGSDWSDYDSGGGTNKNNPGSMYFYFIIMPILVITFFILYPKKVGIFAIAITDISIIVIMLGIPLIIKNSLYPNIFNILDLVSFIVLIIAVILAMIRTLIFELINEIRIHIKSKINKFRVNKQIITKLDKYNYFGYHNLNELLNILYKQFVEIQKAWMNFDYDKLKTLCTDELFESYKSDLDVLKKKNGKNIMKFFIKRDIYIKDIEKNDDHYIIDLVLDVAFFDYVIDENTKSVIRGKKMSLIGNKYSLQFYCYDDKKIICPNCGSEITGSECSYCHTHVGNRNKFVLSTKKKI